MLLFLTTNMAAVTSCANQQWFGPQLATQGFIKTAPDEIQPTEKFEQTLHSHCSIFLLYTHRALNGYMF